jgi:hypothetical protein
MLYITSLLTFIVRRNRLHFHSYHDRFEQEIYFREIRSRPNVQLLPPRRTYSFRSVLPTSGKRSAFLAPEFRHSSTVLYRPPEDIPVVLQEVRAKLINRPSQGGM